MANLSGKEIGKYRITERIGRGGMAEVYLGLHTHLDRQVAIKVLHGHLLEGGDFLARFKREAKAVANLRHPNIVQVHDFDIQDDIIFMVMEYIDGTDLQTKLVELDKKGERLSIKQIGSIIKDIAAALDYAHSKEMLHRDVKPSNILLDKGGKAYLTDFGIARLLSDKKLTATGTLIGTPAYMSPEQGMGEEVARESDIYSLGVVAFRLITGQLPYDAPTPIAIVQKQIADPIPDITKLIDDVPDSAQEVIETALAKSPKSRFPSAEALVTALRGALQALEPLEPSIKTTLVEPAGEAVLHAPPVEMPEAELEPPTELIDEGEPSETLKAPALVTEGEAKDKEETHLKPEIGEKKPSFISSTRNKVIIGVGGLVVIAAVVLGTQFLGTTPPSSEPTQEMEPTIPAAPGIDEMSGEQHFEEAHSLMNQGRWTNAIEALDSAIVAGFENADVYGLRAYAKLNRGNLIPAIDDFTVAIELNPEIFEYWRDRGETQFRLGNLDGALNDLSRGLEINPEDPLGYRYRSRVFSELGGVIEAIDDALQAAIHEPGNFENYFLFYEIYLNHGHPPLERAELIMEMLERALEIDPANPEIHILRGEIFWFDWGDEASALNEYNIAMELGPPGWVVPFDRRGLLYFELGQCELAIEEYSQYIEIDNENPYIFMGRGECYDRLGDVDMARADFVQVMIKTTGIPEFAELRLHAQEWLDVHPE